MFCPNCGAEYRPGFVRCSDCGVNLVASLPARTAALQNDRPERAKPVQFLAWFLPMASFYVATLLPMVVPSLAHNSSFLLFLVLLITTHNFGVLWMLYQSIRYEKHVGRYVLLSLVPGMFVWYRLARYHLRPEIVRRRATGLKANP
jgi:hypothetical protein